MENKISYLANAIEEAIDGAKEMFDLNCAEIVGVLEVMKHAVMLDAIEVVEEEADDDCYGEEIW